MDKALKKKKMKIEVPAQVTGASFAQSLTVFEQLLYTIDKDWITLEIDLTLILQDLLEECFDNIDGIAEDTVVLCARHILRFVIILN